MDMKKIIAGITAVSMLAALTACGGGSETEDETLVETTTTTAATVEVNTEPLSEEDQNTVNDVTALLPDVELENKTIKWFSFYDPFNASTSGNTKSLSLELFDVLVFAGDCGLYSLYGRHDYSAAASGYGGSVPQGWGLVR